MEEEPPPGPPATSPASGSPGRGARKTLVSSSSATSPFASTSSKKLSRTLSMSSPKSLSKSNLLSLGTRSPLSGIGGGEENDSSEKGSSTQSSKGLFGGSSSKKLARSLSMFLPFSGKSNTADEKSSTTGTETGAGTKTAKTGASSSYRFGLSFRFSIKEEEDDAASSVPSLSGKKSIEEKRSEIEVRKLLRLKKRGLYMGSKFWTEREQSFANIPLPELATPSSPRPEDLVSTLASRLHIDPFALEGDAADDEEAKEKRRAEKAEARRQLLESIEQLPDPHSRRVLMFRHSGHHSEEEIKAFELSLVVQEDIKAKEKDKRTLVTVAGERHIPPPKPSSPPPILPQIKITNP